MSLSRLAAKCRACPYIDDCDHKEMEAYGLLPYPPQQTQIIFSESSGDGLIRAGQETGTDELIKYMAGVFRVPEQLLRGGG